jgi:hypothetical protein
VERHIHKHKTPRGRSLAEEISHEIACLWLPMSIPVLLPKAMVSGKTPLDPMPQEVSSGRRPNGKHTAGSLLGRNT